MKNIIYQCWDGELRPGVKASIKNIAEYAKRIGAEHRFEHNANHFKPILPFDYSKYYGAFKPIFSPEFDDYDNILFLDCDIFAVEGLTDSIFDVEMEGIGVCEELFQPQQRVITLGQITSERDEQWARVLNREYGTSLPRTEDGLLRVFNSGVVRYTKEARKIAQRRWVPFPVYIEMVRNNGLINFYALDQNYLHAMLYTGNDIKVNILSPDWNAYVHKTRDKIQPERRVVDHRTPSSKLVHLQMGGADMFDEETLFRMTNKPQEEWGI